MSFLLLGASVPNKNKVLFDTKMANRHGIVAGATGTGKTVTLQVLAEEFSKQGISVFTADAKGDLSGVSQKGNPHEKITERVEYIGIEEYTQQASPCVFWDIYGEKGHPIRTTVSEMGPILLSRLLNLSDVQDAILHMAFKIADDEGLLLLDLKDLRSILSFLVEEKEKFSTSYGNISDVSISSIQRQILILEEAGGSIFFGEKAFDLKHLLQKDASGKGIIHVLDAQKLVHDNRIYSTFLLWLLAELFEDLPEVGDLDKPKLVFFFDEAHLLFDEAPQILIDKIEQVVRLIRSKGVGVYFITQNPLDIPEKVRGQLGNRVQHALRAFTPKEQKAVENVAETFRANEGVNVEELVGSLKVGYALVSTLNEDGEPTPVEHCMMKPPEGRIGTITEAERAEIIASSPFAGIYEEIIDSESAHEILTKRKAEKLEKEAAPKEAENEKGWIGTLIDTVTGGGSTGKRQGYTETFTKQVIRSVGSRLATQIVRGILGSLSKK